MQNGPGWGAHARRAIGWVLIAVSSFAVALAQETPGTVVTGRVTCADTQHAARFASVELVAAGGSDGFAQRRGLSMARTDLDGSYTMPNVNPGDYFVVAQLSGYVNQRGAVEEAMRAGLNPATTVPGVTEIHVGADGATGDLVLQRGAVIAGTVAWDDGTPAAGVQVSVQPAPEATAAATGSTSTGSAGAGVFSVPMYFVGTQTDDRGRYRLPGLAAGSYLVRASVQAPLPLGPGARYSRSLTVAVYAPDKPRKGDATPVKLTTGEERDDVAITLGLSLLHRISGTVSSPGATVRSGSVSVTDQTDSTLNRMGVINADGSFEIPYVPAGSYTLRVNASAQPVGGFGRGGPPQGAGGSFQPLQVPVSVSDTDLTGLSLTVTPGNGAS